MSTPLILIVAVTTVLAAWWISRLGERGPGRPQQSTPASRDRPTPDNIRARLARGEKIEAIRMLRRYSGLGLKESSDAIEAMQRGEMTAFPAPDPAGPADPEAMNEEIRRLLAGNEIIEAIKLYRQVTGAGLEESKEAVDLIRARSQQ